MAKNFSYLLKTNPPTNQQPTHPGNSIYSKDKCRDLQKTHHSKNAENQRQGESLGKRWRKTMGRLKGRQWKPEDSGKTFKVLK